jgi:hypothetical protein
MALLRGKLFAGALFAGLLFGGRTAPLPPTSLPERLVWVKTHAPDQSATTKLPTRNVVQTDWDVAPVHTSRDLWVVHQTGRDPQVLVRSDAGSATQRNYDLNVTCAVQGHFRCGIFQHEITAITHDIEALADYRSVEVWVVTAVKPTQGEYNQSGVSVIR